MFCKRGGIKNRHAFLMCGGSQDSVSKAAEKNKKDLTKVGGGEYIAYNTNVRNFGGLSSKLPIYGSMRCNSVTAMYLCIL